MPSDVDNGHGEAANAYPTCPSLKNLVSESWFRPSAESNSALKSLGAPHVASFDYMLGEGLHRAVEDLPPIEFSVPELDGRRLSIRVDECTISNPEVAPGCGTVREHRIFPTEARQRGTSYKGLCRIRFTYSIDGVKQASMGKVLGNLPIMLCSEACNLKGLSPSELVARGEQETEWGGYFILGGHERIIR